MSSKEKLQQKDKKEEKKGDKKEDKKHNKKEDSLFLIEALIDKIIFPPNPDLPELPEKDFKTCVTVACTNVEPIEICDNEPGGVEHKSGGGLVKVFNCGKSCLFSLNDADIKSAMSKFPVNITVYKALPCGCLPAKLMIGEAEIDLTKEFVEARNTFLKDPSCVSSQALKDTFVINDQEGNLKAEIVMFLRISCFGKLIVTRFQGGAPSLSMGQKSSAAICHTKGNGSQGNLPCTAGHGHGVCAPASDPYGRMICEDPEDPCYCSGPHQRPREPVACRNTDPYCLHVPKGTSLQDSTHGQIEAVKRIQEGKGDLKIEDLFQGKIAHSKPLVMNPYRNSYQPMTTHFKFGNPLTLVYMVSVNDKPIARRRASGSQATALISRYQQVNEEDRIESSTRVEEATNEAAITFNSTYKKSSLLNPAIYYWGKKSTRSAEKKSNAMGPEYSSVTSTGTNYEQQKDDSAKRRNISIANEDSKRRPGRSTKSDESVTKVGKKGSKTSASSEKSKSSSGKSDTKSSNSKMSPKSSSKSNSSKSSGSKNNIFKKKSTKKSGSKSSVSKSSGSKSSESKSSDSKSSDSKSENQSQNATGPTCVNKFGMSVTVKHILIGPVDPCPITGNKPCTGAVCKRAAEAASKSPVSITNVNNPRRGVFELVIRKITGAPFARNELMLEWTLPQPNPSPCSDPSPLLCAIPCYKTCYKPCRSKIYICTPTRYAAPSQSCCGLPCSRPCKKPCCVPCKIPCGSPCRKSCCKPPCGQPCPSSPCTPLLCDGPVSCNSCLRPCPVGRRKLPRRCCSCPRIRPHRVYCSPCQNRSPCCPVVRCRSLPLPKLCNPYRPPYCPPFACSRCVSKCCVPC